MENIRPAALSWMLLSIVFVAACDGGPTRPTDLAEPSVQTVFPTRIEIAGEDSVAPGATTQLTATAYFWDATSRNVTEQSTWISSDVSVFGLSGPGLVAAHARGESFVRVEYQGVQAGRLMFAMPRGTYRLAGVVREDGQPVDGARVDITSGAGKGLFAITDKGQYRIYGVAGDTQVRVTRPDSEPVVSSLDINTNQTLDFDLKARRED
jgi:hypothetical protein